MPEADREIERSAWVAALEEAKDVKEAIDAAGSADSASASSEDPNQSALNKWLGPLCKVTGDENRSEELHPAQVARLEAF